MGDDELLLEHRRLLDLGERVPTVLHLVVEVVEELVAHRQPLVPVVDGVEEEVVDVGPVVVLTKGLGVVDVHQLEAVVIELPGFGQLGQRGCPGADGFSGHDVHERAVGFPGGVHRLLLEAGQLARRGDGAEIDEDWVVGRRGWPGSEEFPLRDLAVAVGVQRDGQVAAPVFALGEQLLGHAVDAAVEPALRELGHRPGLQTPLVVDVGREGELVDEVLLEGRLVERAGILKIAVVIEPAFAVSGQSVHRAAVVEGGHASIPGADAQRHLALRLLQVLARGAARGLGVEVQVAADPAAAEDR